MIRTELIRFQFQAAREPLGTFHGLAAVRSLSCGEAGSKVGGPQKPTEVAPAENKLSDTTGPRLKSDIAKHIKAHDLIC